MSNFKIQGAGTPTPFQHPCTHEHIKEKGILKNTFKQLTPNSFTRKY